ncbi:hypothetical protein [Breoghania sp. JC706]|uniref:hypothetical protein n=1 Tax=Breoghania sp. JC706 TaxID=3117732 RepID=UPI00300B7E3D
MPVSDFREVVQRLKQEIDLLPLRLTDALAKMLVSPAPDAPSRDTLEELTRYLAGLSEEEFAALLSDLKAHEPLPETTQTDGLQWYEWNDERADDIPAGIEEAAGRDPVAQFADMERRVLAALARPATEPREDVRAADAVFTALEEEEPAFFQMLPSPVIPPNAGTGFDLEAQPVPVNTPAPGDAVVSGGRRAAILLATCVAPGVATAIVTAAWNLIRQVPERDLYAADGSIDLKRAGFETLASVGASTVYPLLLRLFDGARTRWVGSVAFSDQIGPTGALSFGVPLLKHVSAAALGGESINLAIELAAYRARGDPSRIKYHLAGSYQLAFFGAFLANTAGEAATHRTWTYTFTDPEARESLMQTLRAFRHDFSTTGYVIYEVVPNLPVWFAYEWYAEKIGATHWRSFLGLWAFVFSFKTLVGGAGAIRQKVEARR